MILVVIGTLLVPDWWPPTGWHIWVSILCGGLVVVVVVVVAVVVAAAACLAEVGLCCIEGNEMFDSLH